MSVVANRTRSAVRWLLKPLLQGIDRRIALRLQQQEERVTKAERDVDSLRGYMQLVVGTMLPAPDSASYEASKLGRQETPHAEGDSAPLSHAVAASGPGDFSDRFCCPACRAAVPVVPEIVTADGRVKRGYVTCSRCDAVVGVVRDFHVDFRTLGGTPPVRRPEPRLIPAVGELRISFDDPRLAATGGWTTWDDRFKFSHGAVTDFLEYRGRFTDAMVLLVAHANGGIVDFFIDGAHVGVADLYLDSAEWFVMPFPVASDLAHEEHSLRIQPRGTKHVDSGGAHVYVVELVLGGPRTDPSFGALQPLNRGNPYMEVFERHIQQVPPNELILEVGGGERRRLRPGYVNLEYLSLECADVYGDITHLPFQEGTFRLVLAQAVFEHVTDPFKAAAELVRVAAPGGLIVVDAAFMQPLHAAPHHFFNMTPMGLAELFKSCSIVECDHYDGLASTVEWMLQSAGARAVSTDSEFAGVIEAIRRMEAKLSHMDIRPACSGWWVVARKPDLAATARGESGLQVSAAGVHRDGEPDGPTDETSAARPLTESVAHELPWEIGGAPGGDGW